MDDARILALVQAQAEQVDAIEELAIAQVASTMGAVSDWTDHDEITRAATVAGQSVRSSSQASAGATDAFLTRVMREMVGGSPRLAGVIDVSQPLRSGVRGYDSIYGRVADTVRYQMSKGLALDDAVTIGLQRADAMTRTDLALARREQSRRWMQSQPETVVGYRRVVHPELSKSGTCGLCIAAADRRHSRGDLLPLHARCKCTVMPITGEHDPGGALNNADFAEAYALASSTSKRDLAEVRVRVVNHGELGPVLTNAAHRSTDTGKYRRAREQRGQEQVRRPDTAAASQEFFATARRNR